MQNPESFALYKTKRSFVALDLGKPIEQVETTPLWHATNESVIQKITHSQFDRGLSGAVGMIVLMSLRKLVGVYIVGNVNLSSIMLLASFGVCWVLIYVIYFDLIVHIL